MLKKLVAVCLAGYLAFAGSQLLAAGDAATGEAIATGCKCHRGEFNGHPAESIVKELQAFKAGTRTNKFMNKKAASMSDQDIEDVAAWFASQPK